MGSLRKEKRWWLAQRTHGVALAVRQAVDYHDLRSIARLTETKAGLHDSDGSFPRLFRWNIVSLPERPPRPPNPKCHYCATSKGKPARYTTLRHAIRCFAA